MQTADDLVHVGLLVEVNGLEEVDLRHAHLLARRQEVVDVLHLFERHFHGVALYFLAGDDASQPVTYNREYQVRMHACINISIRCICTCTNTCNYMYMYWKKIAKKSWLSSCGELVLLTSPQNVKLLDDYHL